MAAGHTYLLGTGKQYPRTWNRPYVTLTVASDGRKPVLGFADGFLPHDCGGSCDPADVLRRPAYLQRLRELGLGWFLPYIERMAAGENFTVDEFQRVYYQHTGRQMEASSDTGHFRFIERPNENDVA